MTKKEREVLVDVYEKIYHIVGWDNKNLKQGQFIALDECRQSIRDLFPNREVTRE